MCVCVVSRYRYKPLPRDGAAIFIANHAATVQTITVDFAGVPSLSGHAPFTVTDVWSQFPLEGTYTNYTALDLGSHDSCFLTVAPAKE